MALTVDPKTGALIEEKELENKKNQEKNYDDLNKIDYGETTLVPDAEDNSEIFIDKKSDYWNKEGQSWAKFRASRYFRKIVAFTIGINFYL